MAIRHFAPKATAESLVTALADDGALVLDGVIDAGAVAQLRSEYAPFLSQVQHGRDRFEGTRTRRVGSLLARCPSVRELVTLPIILEVSRKIFADATTVQLNAAQLVALSPDEAPQGLHRDQWAWDQFDFPPGFEVELSTMWALTDFTEANGATRVSIGSHRDERSVEDAETTLSLAEMEAGSVLFYTGSVYHGAGANRTDHVREGMILSYTRGWLRPHENQFLSVPNEIAREFSETLQRLIGYERGSYAIGYYGDMQDPIEAVRPGRGSRGLGGSQDVPSRGD